VGKKTGPNPTDRAKEGAKRSVLTDGRGVPIGLAVDGANRHDIKMVDATLASVPVKWPQPSPEHPQNLCLDKGYDCDPVRELIAAYHLIAHIKARGVEATEKRNIPGFRARRWVVERTHGWINRFRRLLIRWEKKAENYVALLHFVCGIIAFRAAGVLG
jgi:putative transposase